MKLGKLFKAIVKLPLLPAAIVADVMTMGASKSCNDEFITEKALKSIGADLDEATF